MSYAFNRIVSTPAIATEISDGLWEIEWEDPLRCKPTRHTWDEVLRLRARPRARNQLPFSLVPLEAS